MSNAMHSASSTYHGNFAFGTSVHQGETWRAYRKGEDKTFKTQFVSRSKNGVMCTVVNTRKALVDNAKMLGVELTWTTARRRNRGKVRKGK
jgi:hypothetical protein